MDRYLIDLVVRWAPTVMALIGAAFFSRLGIKLWEEPAADPATDRRLLLILVVCILVCLAMFYATARGQGGGEVDVDG